MSTHRRFSLASAFDAAEHDDLARWVGEFLASRGSDNATLAAGLATRRHWWLGPARIPLDRLERLAGPEDDTLCPVEPDEWEHDVDAMEESIEEGWEPAPLIAQYRDGALLLQDGNHRYEALVRAGETDTWVIVWCDDPHDRDAFADELHRGPGSGRDDELDVRHIARASHRSGVGIDGPGGPRGV